MLEDFLLIDLFNVEAFKRTMVLAWRLTQKVVLRVIGTNYSPRKFPLEGQGESFIGETVVFSTEFVCT